MEKFTRLQIKMSVDVCIGIGTLSLGSAVLPAILEKWSFVVFLIGLTVTLVFWYIGFRIAGTKNE